MMKSPVPAAAPSPLRLAVRETEITARSLVRPDIAGLMFSRWC